MLVALLLRVLGRGPSFATGSQKSDATIVQPLFFLFPTPGRWASAQGGTGLFTPKDAYSQLSFPLPPPPMSSFKGGTWGRLSLGRREPPHYLRPQQPAPGGRRTAPLARGAGPILMREGRARAPLCSEVAKGPEDLSRTEPLLPAASQLSFLNTVAAAQPTEFSDFFIPLTTHTWR